MLDIDSSAFGAWLGQFLWPLVRVGAFMMAAPVFGAQNVPARVRVLLALTLAAALAMALPPQPRIDDIGLQLVVGVSRELVVGVVLGFAVHVFLQAFVLAGQLVAMQMGLGFAAMVDPANGITVAIVSQFYLMLVTLLFIAMGGHVVLIQVLAESFRVFPVGGTQSLQPVLERLVGHGAWMFGSALLIALPAVSALLLVNLAFGVMTRAAPQLNVFSLGFPVSLLFGLAVLWASTAEWSLHFDAFATEFLVWHRDLLAAR